MKINLGCGTRIKEGWINCDKYPISDAVLDVDLNDLPLPFDDNVADEILLCHVLEHINNRYALIEDCHRILKRGGILRVMLPIYGNVVEHESYNHSIGYFDNFSNHASQNYDRCNFRIVSIKKHIYPCRARVVEKYERLKTWIHSLIYFEYEWEMEKQ